MISFILNDILLFFFVKDIAKFMSVTFELYLTQQGR